MPALLILKVLSLENLGFLTKMTFSTIVRFEVLIIVEATLNPVELDLFGIEVKSRKMIHDLINPLVDRMNEERAKMTAYNERAKNIEERMINLECMNGITETKPKIFQDIFNEIANIREQAAAFESKVND